MIAAMNALADQTEVAVWTAFIVFARVGAIFAVLPLFGEQSIPARIRLILAVAVSLLVWPAVTLPSVATLSGADFVLILLMEIPNGLVLGIFLRILIHGLQIAGSIAAQSTSLSQILGGAAVDPQPAVGHILLVAGLALLVSMGFHVKLVGFVVVTYDFLRIGSLPNPLELADAGVRHVAQMFALGLGLAAPFVISATIYNIALGAINRAMPQLMVSFVGAPALTGAGLIILALTAPLMLGIWVGTVHDFLSHPFGG